MDEPFDYFQEINNMRMLFGDPNSEFGKLFRSICDKYDEWLTVNDDPEIRLHAFSLFNDALSVIQIEDDDTVLISKRFKVLMTRFVDYILGELNE